MKNWAIFLIVILLGFRVAIQAARAALPMPGAPPSREHDPDILGPRLGGESWNAPAATVNPGVLIPEDSDNSGSLNEFTEHHFESTFGRDSFQLADTFKSDVTEVENVKPIEKIEARSEDPLYDQPATVMPPHKSETKRIFLIALASVAFLAFRKFRRPQAGMPRRKPNFL